MKTSTILVGMTITLLLLALPAGAADYTLGVFGNANGDDTIDMVDVTYTERIIMELNDETQFADAKYDGEVDILDVTQIELIILGREKELTFLDGFGEVMTVTKPVERIVSVWCTNNELLKVLDATDKIVGIDAGMTGKSTTLFPEISALPDCGGWYAPNFEAILSQHPDMYIPWLIATDEPPESGYGIYGIARKRFLEEKLMSVPVLCIDNSEYRTGEYFIEELKRLGYILDRREEAKKFTEFYNKCMDPVVEQTEGLTDDEKPSVWITSLFFSGGAVTSSPYVYTAFDPVDLAGARNIAADIPSDVQVDLEWVIDQDPKYIFIQIWAAGNCKSPYAPDYSISVVEEQANIVLNCPELSEVDAVKNKRVYVVQYSHFSKGTSRCLCVAYMAKLFHPGLFEDLKPHALHQEYVDQFLGIDVSVESANFLYSPLEES
jgi:iron complex transport system substrate-binding protein